MHYCSLCGSSNGQPVMTYKDGSIFDSGTFMTTTDSLQAAWLYCNNRNDYVEKEHMSCNSGDKFGVTRPIFLDRVCDNKRHCFGGEDESLANNALATCIPDGQATANGCCASYVIDEEEFALAGQVSGADAYLSTTNSNRQS